MYVLQYSVCDKNEKDQSSVNGLALTTVWSSFMLGKFYIKCTALLTYAIVFTINAQRTQPKMMRYCTTTTAAEPWHVFMPAGWVNDLCTNKSDSLNIFVQTTRR